MLISCRTPVVGQAHAFAARLFGVAASATSTGHADETHEERRTCRRGVWYTVALYRPVYGRGEGDGRELGSTCDGVTVKRRRPVAPVYGERSKINSRVFVNSVPSVLRFAAKICFSFLPISSVMAAVAVSGIS